MACGCEMCHNTGGQRESKCQACGLQCIDPHSVFKLLVDAQPIEESFILSLLRCYIFQALSHFSYTYLQGPRRRGQTLHLTSHSAWLCSGKTATLKPFSALALSLFSRPEWLLFSGNYLDCLSAGGNGAGFFAD